MFLSHLPSANFEPVDDRWPNMLDADRKYPALGLLVLDSKVFLLTVDDDRNNAWLVSAAHFYEVGKFGERLPMRIPSSWVFWNGPKPYGRTTELDLVAFVGYRELVDDFPRLERIVSRDYAPDPIVAELVERARDD